MKKLLLTVLVVLGILYLEPHLDISYQSEPEFQEEVSKFAQTSIRKVFVERSVRELTARHIAQDESKEDGFKWLLSTLDYKLGKLSSCKEALSELYTRWEFINKDEFWRYEGACKFSKGVADLTMDFKQVNEHWYIYRFSFDSELLE